MKTKIKFGLCSNTSADLTNKQPEKLIIFQDSTVKNGNKEIEKQGPADFETAIKACGYGKFNYFLLLALVPASAAQVFATGTMSFSLPSAECDLKLTNFHKGALNASVYAGMMISSFFWGFILDVFGRRKLITIGFTLDFIFNFTGAFSHEFWLLLLLRFCVGLAVSAPNAAIFSYVAETHSQELRPRIIMITCGLYIIGQSFLPTLALLVIPMDFRIPLLPGILDFVSWRLFIMICSSASLLSAILFGFFPESPGFLMNQGRLDEAIESFQRIYAANSGNARSFYPIKELLHPSKDDVEVARLETTDTAEVKSKGIWTTLRNGWAQVRPIFRPPHLKVALFLFGIQTSIMLSFNSLQLWNPQLLTTLNRAMTSSLPEADEATTICDLLTLNIVPSSDESSENIVCLPVQRDVYVRTLIIGLAISACFIIITPLVGLIARKTVARICVLLGAAFALSINWVTSNNVYMAVFSLYIGFLEASLSILSGLVVDSFPTDFRSMAVGLLIMSGRVGSMLGNLIFPVLLSATCQGTFFAVAGELTVVGIVLWFIPKKPEGN